MVRLLSTMTRRDKDGMTCYRGRIMYLLLASSFVLSFVDIDRGVRHLRAVDVIRFVPVTEDPPSNSSQKASPHGQLDNPSTIKNDTEWSKYLVNETIWAVVTPPGFLGGYLNQVIRMLGLVVGAKQHNVHQLLLPSLLWSTTTRESPTITRPVPMEALFDIDHWNTFQPQLPRLVAEIPSGDCWSSNVDGWLWNPNGNLTVDGPLLKSVLEKPRFLTPIANLSLAYVTGELEVNPRRFDVFPHIQHCRHPVPYGAGGGRGQLWVNYMKYSRQRQRQRKGLVVEPDPLERSFLQALQPLPKWKRLGQQCVVQATRSSSNNKGDPPTSTAADSDNPTPSYIAVHPRIELEMMAHACGTYMNKNLTRILQDVTDFLLQQRQTPGGLANVSGVFVAFSRQGASVTQGSAYQRFRNHVDDNIRTMNRVLGTDSLPGQGIRLQEDQPLPVFECGEQMLQTYYESQKATTEQPIIHYGSLLSSIINFQVAVEATAFVGMRYSSWSNNVWTTRYYLGRGDGNFEYTRQRGIQPMENGGLPPPHQNCEGIKDPGR